MGQTKSLVLLAGAALSLCASGALAQQASSDEIRATVAEMLSDAETRSSLLSSGDAGHDGRFFIAGDGFRLNVGGQLQVRYIADFRDDQNNDDFINGFQLRRIKLNFQGDINKDWFFRVRASADSGGVVENELDTGGNPTGRFTSANTGGFSPDYAYAGYKFANGVRVTAGQFKLPLLREELVSSTRQLTVERSAVNATFTQSRSQGVELGYATERFRAFAALSDGLSTPNTDFIDAAEADLGVTARAEWMVAGREFKRFDDNTSWRQSGTAAMLGGAIHHQWGGETGGTLDADVTQGTLDASVEGDGWNAFVAGVWRHRDSGGGDPDDFGIVVQGGVFATERLEFFVRYDVLLPDAGDAFETATAGFNCYITPRSHALKLTGDVVYYLDQTDATPIVRTGTALPLLVDMEGDQVVLRLQFQIVF